MHERKFSSQELNKRNVPDIPEYLLNDRGKLQELICREVYGYMPSSPLGISYETVYKDDSFCAGNAELTKVLLKIDLEEGSFSFPIYCSVPKARVSPAFVHINFRDAVPDRYMPNEEICDHGFAVISFCYSDVTSDDGNFSDGLAGVIYRNKKRDLHSPGKIALWAWGAMRAMDYVQTLDGIDKKNIAVVGHSRLGKTALVAGAFDERFSYVISNDSGCSGAAISRQKAGETINDICTMFPFWFCENYKQYMKREALMPFDQHYLLSLTAPRKLYVASAAEDIWADPDSEYLACIAADNMYRAAGETGFIHPDRFPHENEILHAGNIGYHKRSGGHYLSRYDWLRFIEFMKKTC